jgi:hypothetical protein
MELHEATNGHFCSYCGMIASECADEDKNHVCDVCELVLSSHETAEDSHICTYCGKVLSKCTDIDKNHICDRCGTSVGKHEALNGSNVCTYCGEVVYHPISIVGSTFVTALGLEFETSLTATTAIPAGRIFTLRYDSTAANYISASSEFVSVQADGDQLILTALKDISANSVFAALTFKTAEDLTAGSYDFLFVDETEFVTGEFAPILIYQFGDVNLDGNVNSRDVLMIKQYVVKMIELSDVQKVYANVYADLDGEGNPNINSRDALLLQQYVVKMDVVLGEKKN